MTAPRHPVRPSRELGQLGQRLKAEWRDAVAPPTEFGQLEVYQAFLPGRNLGRRSVDNAPVLGRVSALAIDLALFSGTFLTIVVALALTVSPSLLLLGLAFPLGFYFSQSLFDATGGTIGKRTMGLRVVGPADTPVDFGQAAKRNVWLLLPLIPVAGPVAAVGVGLWFAGVAKADAFGVAPHDRNARTRVVRR